MSGIYINIDEEHRRLLLEQHNKMFKDLKWKWVKLQNGYWLLTRE